MNKVNITTPNGTTRSRSLSQSYKFLILIE